MALYYTDTSSIKDVLGIGDRFIYIPQSGIFIFSSREYSVLDIGKKQDPTPEDIENNRTAAIYSRTTFNFVTDETIEAIRLLLHGQRIPNILYATGMDEIGLVRYPNNKIPAAHSMYRVAVRREPNISVVLKLIDGMYVPVAEINNYADTHVQAENKIYMFVLDKSRSFHVFIYDPSKNKIKSRQKSTKPISQNIYLSVYTGSKIYIYTDKTKDLDIFDIRDEKWERVEFKNNIIKIFTVGEYAYALLDNGVFYKVRGNTMSKKMALPEGYDDIENVQEIVANEKYILILHSVLENAYTHINVYDLRKKQFYVDEIELNISKIVYLESGYLVDRRGEGFLLYESHKGHTYTYIFDPVKFDYKPTMFSYEGQLPFVLSDE